MRPDDALPAEPAPTLPPAATGRSRRLVACLLLLAAGVTGVVGWFLVRPDPPVPPPAAEGAFPPDPRLTYGGPFRNIHPDVQYVGDARCAECHDDIHRTYRRHPMGRSLVPMAELAGQQVYGAERRNPFETFGITFRVEREGGEVRHHQSRPGPDGKPVYDFAHEVDYAVGSGGRGHSYLTVRDGTVWQTPVSWFSEKGIWDLSPGFREGWRTGRMIQAACLFCHANRVEPVEGTRNRYHEPVFRGHAIGCERCHGPGELHATSTAKDDIVNPSRLAPRLREAVCQQCHLQGAARVLRRGRGINDFRPGLPLQDFFTVFVKAQGEDRKAVSHVEQMYQSRCFERSPAEKKLGCISCHNPHEAVAAGERVPYFRSRCLQCHQEHDCELPEAVRAKETGNSCTTCHMPRFASSDVAHVASTDHRIVRRPGAADREPDRPRGGPPLMDFHRGMPDVKDRGMGRDLAVAMYEFVLRGMPLRGPDGEFLLELLGAALDECPGDLMAWEARGTLLQTMRRFEDAAEAFEAVRKRQPDHEGAAISLGQVYRELDNRDLALENFRRAVAINPWSAAYREKLALQLAERGAWAELGPHARKWVELDPASTDARRVLVQYLAEIGQAAEARAEFETLRALRPPNLPELEAWFAAKSR